MTDREKMIELLNVEIYPHEAKSPAEVVADYLLDNGVTVQRWIPVTERLPEDGEQVLACTKNGRAFSAHYDHFWGKWSVSHTVKITHWMPLPEPPKEVE